MPDATITSTASTFGTISGTFAADQSTVTGTITAITGTVDGSVGVPGPAGPTGAAGQGVPIGGTAGQFLTKIDSTNYNTDWTTVNLSVYLLKAGGVITGDIQSNNGSGYRSYDGLYSQVNVSAANIQLLNAGPGGNTLTVEWDGITFADGKQTVKFPGAATLFANAALTGNPSAPTPATLDDDTSIATTAFVKAQGYITSSALAPYLPLAGGTMSGTLFTPTIRNLLNTNLVIDAYNDTGAGTHNYYIFNPYGGGFELPTSSAGIKFGDATVQTTAAISGDRYLTTSTTSNTISNGNKTFTIGTGLSYTPTQSITISYDASNHMHGEVLTYNSGTGVLTVDINHHTGSGTYAAWVVNVGGVVPVTSVAWGGITGTLSTQTDLQNALDLKANAADYLSKAGNLSGLASTATARTNLLLGATNTVAFRAVNLSEGAADISDTLSTLDLVTASGAYVVTGSSASYVDDGSGFPIVASSGLFAVDPAQFYFYRYPTYDSSNPSNATVGNELNYDGNSGSFSIRSFNTLSPSDQTITMAASGVTLPSAGSITFGDSTVQTTAYTGGGGLITSVTSPLAVTSGDLSIDLSAKADLASPTFTGTPTLPTGSIGVTQTAGNNTTALATTAFVTAAVPAFATDAQARDQSNTTTSLSPKSSIWQHMSAAFLEVPRAGFALTNVGTMGTTQHGWLGTQFALGTVGACSGRGRVFGGSQVDQTLSMMSKTTLFGINFSKPTWCSGRAYPNSTITDPNVTAGWYFGKAENTGPGNLARRGFGWEVIGNATTRYLTLTVHDGTTLTKVTSSYVVTNGTIFDWDVVSDGAGNVTLYVEGVSVVTTALGPTGDTNYSGTRPVIWQEELRTTALTTSVTFAFGRGRIYMAL